jgi:hypothetical protein
MQALNERSSRTASQAGRPVDHRALQERTATILLDALSFLAPNRIADSVRDWLARMDLSGIPLSVQAALMTKATAMPTSLALFTPSSSGTVAVDRLVRVRGRLDSADAAAVTALRQTQFRLVRVLDAAGDRTARLHDVATGQVIELRGAAIGAGHAGLHLAAWLAPLPGGAFSFTGPATPLDDSGLAVAMGFVRTGRTGLVNPVRCAEAVYRHVLRHGTIRIPGLNEPLAGQTDDSTDDADDLDHIALDWAKPDAERDPDDVQFVRAQTDLDTILAMLASAANKRDHGLNALSGAYTAIALIQLETVQRRASVGSGLLRVAMVEAALISGIAAGEVPSAARSIFDAVRRRLGSGPGAEPAGRTPDAELDKLIGRIQALRAKTVEQGCTEQEALAAAEKVAELLDRYGLSLSELDLQRQSCEGLAVETTRKRAGPLDDCVPATAAFFDCRVWGEKGSSGTLRYVFFGLRADVAAARYLYELVDQAFVQETALFRAGETYAAMPARLRRTATNSFQIGLGRGITTKLQALRSARETDLRRSSGRDLVVVKAGLVEAELSSLGLNFQARSRSGNRRVLSEAFEQGKTAGLGFSYTPGIGALAICVNRGAGRETKAGSRICAGATANLLNTAAARAYGC